MARKRRSYKFTEKTHSKKAMVSAGMAGISEIMYLVFVYLSFKQAGMLSTYFGGFGVLAMAMAVVALVLAATTFKEEDSFPLYPTIAMGISILASISWVGTYILGFIRG